MSVIDATRRFPGRRSAVSRDQVYGPVSAVIRDRLQRIGTKAFLRSDDETLGLCLVALSDDAMELHMVAAVIGEALKPKRARK